MPPKRKPNSAAQAKDTEDSKRQRVEESPGPSGCQPGNAIKAKRKAQKAKKVSAFHEKYDAIWNHILACVSLNDLYNFYVSNQKTKEIAKRFLASGREIRLTWDFLEENSFSYNKDLYKFLGSFTRNFTIIGSHWDAHQPLLLCKNLDHLTLQNMTLKQFDYNKTTIPCTPKGMSLINCVSSSPVNYVYRTFGSYRGGYHETESIDALALFGPAVTSMEIKEHRLSFDVVQYRRLERLSIVLPTLGRLHITKGKPYSSGYETVDKTTCKLNTLALKAGQFIADAAVPVTDRFGQKIPTSEEALLDLPNLKRLSITVQRPAEPQEFPVRLAGLLHYSLDGDWAQMSKGSQKNLSENMIRHSPQLQTLELPGFVEKVDFLLKCEHLQTLTITSALTKGQDKLLDGLQKAKPNLTVNYPNKSVGPVESQVLKLPEDCLLLILSHLGKEDMMTIRRVNRQFRKLFGVQAALTWKEGINIDKKFISKYPLESCTDIYESIGRGAATLNLEDQLPEDTVILMLQHFPRIKTLHLNICGFKKTKAIAKFPLVEELHLTGHSKYMVNLYEHVRPTLKKLGCYTPGPNLLQIKNLEELTITNYFLRQDLSEFWDHNQELSSLRIVMDKDLMKGYGATIQKNWQRIGELPLLKKLEFPFLSKSYSSGVMASHLSQMETFPALEVFKIDKTLSMNAEQEFITKFGPSLKEYSASGWLIRKDIYNLKSLERLSLYFGWNKVSQLLTELPNLKELEHRRNPLKQVYNEELVSFLHSSNRTLKYNGTLLPLHPDDTDLDKYP